MPASPVHTDAVRRARAEVARSQSSSAGWSAPVQISMPPATMTVSTSPRTADHGQSAVIVRPDVALLIASTSEHAANVTLYGTLRSRPASRSFIIAVAKISMGPTTSSDCAVGAASKTPRLDNALSPDSPISSGLGVVFPCVPTCAGIQPSDTHQLVDWRTRHCSQYAWRR
jgi:hypothetical protein